MYLIVGLGNPGKEYESTRHNLGFMVIDELSQRLSITKFKSKFNAQIAEANINGHKIALVKPQTFMNNSGRAVQEIAAYYKVDPANIILVFDDVDLEVGQVRIRESGSAGGHNGAQSVIDHLSANDFSRIRLGIGASEGDTADHVLDTIAPAEKKPLQLAIETSAEAAEEIVNNGVTAAMNKYSS